MDDPGGGREMATRETGVKRPEIVGFKTWPEERYKEGVPAHLAY